MKKINNLIRYLNNNGFKKEAAYLKKEASIGLGTLLFLFTGCVEEDQCLEKPTVDLEYTVVKGDNMISIMKKPEVYGPELTEKLESNPELLNTLINIVKVNSMAEPDNLRKNLKYIHPGNVLIFPNKDMVAKNFEVIEKTINKKEKKSKDKKEEKPKGIITWNEYKKDDFDMDQTIPVAKNFTFREVSDSDTKPKLTGGSKNKLKSESQFDAHMEAVKILQRIRDEFGPIEVTSGYRGHSLNKAVGGVSSSCHKKGVGFDIKFEDGNTKKYWKKMKNNRKTKWKDIGECFYYQKAGHIHFTAKPCGGDGHAKDWKILNK